MKHLRIHIVILIVLPVLAGAILSSCSKEESNRFESVLIIYMAANNNLDSYARDNISDIKSGYVPGADDDRALLLFTHLSGEEPVLKRLYKRESGEVFEQIISTYSGESSSDASTLSGVLREAEERFHADSYGLILWSHSTGWLPEGYYDTHPSGGVFFEDPYASIVKSFGYDNGSEMELTDLASAIPYKLSYIIFDACFNGGIETIYELKEKADFIVASPTEILATGFPYKKIVEPLLTGPDLTQVCDYYYEYYTTGTGYNSATIALYDTKHLASLATVAASVFTNHRAEINLVDPLAVQPYFRLNKHWFYDLQDFISKFATDQEYLNFRTALERVVIYKLNTPQFLDINIQRYSGISTYIPVPADNELDSYYKRYKWNSDSGMIR